MRLRCVWTCLVALVPSFAAAGDRYVVDPAASEFLVQVGKSGLFKFAGHVHEVAAPIAEGHIEADAADLSRSSVTLRFQASALKVTGKGDPPEDVPKVQEAMTSEKVLDVAKYAEIVFTSSKVTGKAAGPAAFDLQVEGALALHGATKTITLPVHAEKGADGVLTVTGKTVLKQ